MDTIIKYLKMFDETDEKERFEYIIKVMHEYDLEIYISRGLIDKLGLFASGSEYDDMETALDLNKDDRKVLTDYLLQVILRYDGHDKDKLYLAMLHL